MDVIIFENGKTADKKKEEKKLKLGAEQEKLEQQWRRSSDRLVGRTIACVLHSNQKWRQV